MLDPKRFLITLFCTALLCSCQAKQPQDIADQYWRAVFSGDTATLETVVTEESRDIVNTVRVPESGSSYSLGKANLVDEHRAEVETTVKLVQDGNVTTSKINTVLLKENEEWKVDLRQTRRSLYASLLQQAFDDIGDSLEQGAAAVQELGTQLAQELNQNLIDATEEIQQQAQEAHDAFQEALQQLEDELNDNSSNP